MSLYSILRKSQDSEANLKNKQTKNPKTKTKKHKLKLNVKTSWSKLSRQNMREYPANPKMLGAGSAAPKDHC